MYMALATIAKVHWGRKDSDGSVRTGGHFVYSREACSGLAFGWQS